MERLHRAPARDARLRSLRAGVEQPPRLARRGELADRARRCGPLPRLRRALREPRASKPGCRRGIRDLQLELRFGPHFERGGPRARAGSRTSRVDVDRCWRGCHARALRQGRTAAASRDAGPHAVAGVGGPDLLGPGPDVRSGVPAALVELAVAAVDLGGAALRFF